MSKNYNITENNQNVESYKFSPYEFIKLERAIYKKNLEIDNTDRNPRLKQMKNNLDSLQNLMQSNLNELILRGDNLESVFTKAFELKELSSKFSSKFDKKNYF